MSKFQTGDVVEYVGSHNWSKQHIIHEVSYEGSGQFSYSTNNGAWFQESDFKLIRKANKKSFAKLDKDLAYECGDCEL